MNNYPNKYCLNYKFSPFLAFFVSVLAFISWLLLSSETMLSFVAEYGIVETTTLIFYALAIIIIWLPKSISVSLLTTRITGSFILLAMLAREADLHKTISGVSMFKLRFWIGNYPIEEKLLSALIILPIAASVIYMAVKYYKSFFYNLSKRKTDAYTLMTFFIVMVISKIIDRSIDVINKRFNWDAPIELVALQNAFEEYLELLLPILIIIFIYQYIKIYGSKELKR